MKPERRRGMSAWPALAQYDNLRSASAVSAAIKPQSPAEESAPGNEKRLADEEHLHDVLGEVLTKVEKTLVFTGAAPGARLGVTWPTKTSR